MMPLAAARLLVVALFAAIVAGTPVRVLILGGVSPGLMAQVEGPSLQTTVERINQILSDYPDQDPSVIWRQQRLEVGAGQLIYSTATKGLDGSIQESRWTASISDLKGAVWSEGRVLIQCRDDASCAQLWLGADEWHPLPARSRAITLDTSAAGEMADRLVTACKHLADLLGGNAAMDANDPSAKRPN